MLRFWLLSVACGPALLLASAAANNADQPHTKAVDLQRESLKKQRDSLRHQLGAHVDDWGAGFPFLKPILPLAEGDCPALETDYVEALIARAARKHSLSTQLLRAVMRQESAFKPCAVSIRGAQGLMQLMPATALELHVSDPFDPEQNVEGGARFLKQLLRKYKGDLRLALVAYNAGASRADQLDPVEYPVETQGYLANILAELQDPEASDN